MTCCDTPYMRHAVEDVVLQHPIVRPCGAKGRRSHEFAGGRTLAGMDLPLTGTGASRLPLMRARQGSQASSLDVTRDLPAPRQEGGDDCARKRRRRDSMRQEACAPSEQL